MTIVVESDIFAVIIINSGSGDNRSAEVSSYVLSNILVVSKSRLGINIETLFAVLVDVRFDRFKRRN